MPTGNDEKLDEVKAILRQLQRIGTGEEELPPIAPEAPRKAAPPHWRADIASSALRRPAAAPARSQGKAGAGMAVALGAAALVAAGGLGYVVWQYTSGPQELAAPLNTPGGAGKAGQTEASPEEGGKAAAVRPSGGSLSIAAPPTAPGATSSSGPQADLGAERLSQAQRLIDEGKVTAARQILLGGLAEGNGDAALVLARSYDPNSLRQIANADAAPNAQEAERWYRRWNEIAAASGLALDSQRLDRIIKAMK